MTDTKIEHGHGDKIEHGHHHAHSLTGGSTTLSYNNTKTKVKATFKQSSATFTPDDDTWKTDIPKGVIVTYNTSGSTKNFKTTNGISKATDDSLTANQASNANVVKAVKKNTTFFEAKTSWAEKAVADAVEYSIGLTLTDAQVSKFETVGFNIVLMKGKQDTPALTPVWVSEPPAQSLGFSWDEVYGVYYSKSDYKSGVTIKVGGSVTDIDMTNGCSYFLDDTSSLLQKQSAGTEKGTVLIQDKASYDIIAGLSQVVSTTGPSRFSLNYAPITSSYCLAKSGQVRAQPLVPFTIGLGGYYQSQLYKKSDLNGAASFVLDPSAPHVDLVFDDTQNKFIKQ
jgi:hypothetical protein